MRTLVVGGEYAEIDGDVYVPERCWRMVQLFSDALADPVFTRRRVESTDRTLYSTRFPHAAALRPTNPSPRRPPWQVAFPDRSWNRRWQEQLLADVDAVYCRLPHWEGLQLYELALRRGKIALASIHGDWAGVYAYEAARSRPPRSLVYARLSRVVHRSLLRVARTSRVLFCVGPQLLEKYGSAAPAAVNFANYLHREADLHERADTCQQPPYRVLFVGQLEARKGVRHLLRAAAQLKGSGTPVELSLVGAGDARSELAAEAGRLGLADAVRFHGYVPFGPQLLALYAEADLFALPAVVGEGLPKVVVEAMSQGLPLVASDVGSTRFLLEESGAGLLVPPEDETALASGLRTLIEDAGLRQRSIRAGLAFARRTTVDHQRVHIARALAEHLPELVTSSRVRA